MKINEIVAKRVFELRVASGLRQQDLVERLFQLGIVKSAHYVSQIESKRKANPSAGEVGALALALEVSPLALLLPSSEADTVEVTPEAHMSGSTYRRWTRGLMASWRSGGFEASRLNPDAGKWTWWTIDSQPEDANLERLRRAGRQALHTKEELAAYDEFPTARRLIDRVNSIPEQLVELYGGVAPQDYEVKIEVQLEYIKQDIGRLLLEIERFRTENPSSGTTRPPGDRAHGTH